ncbi:polyphosphate kinase [soil metagenome]
MNKKKQISEYFFNRELSWVEFNRKVLDEAKDLSNPLLERLKFLSIFSSNLDEFFMIRVSGLTRQVTGGINEVSTDGMAPKEILDELYSKLAPMVKEQYRIYNEIILPELKQNEISLVKYSALTSSERIAIDKYFEDEVFPVLTPLAIDNVHPFPNLINRSLTLAILLIDAESELKEEKLSVIQVPSNIIERFYRIESREDHSYVLLEDIIQANIDKLFPGMTSIACNAFRITRNADLELEEEEADDLLTLIEEEVKKRRLGQMVRLELHSNMRDNLKNFLISVLEIDSNQIYNVDGPINLGDLMNLYKIDKRSLKYDAFTPRISSYFREEENIFKAIESRDIMLHHPFYSFSSVNEFIAQAAEDPSVYAIKLTLYRTSGDSPIIKALMQAAENGKQVTAVVELKARFDEENNIIWARALENAGVHVVYGLVGLKTHCKIALVVKKTDKKMKRYVHLSTGNYNSTTARFYTDFGLFTCDENFGRDATNLFNYLTGYSKTLNFKELTVAPVGMRKKILDLISGEILAQKSGKKGYIFAKMNSIVDEEIIMKLYEASTAGVKIDLFVRGICRLKPGIEGLSENINVYSLVGRFLEHSRAFYFRNDTSQLYLASADWMPRNLDRRIEILFPVKDKRIREDIKEILDLYLTDTVKLRKLDSKGLYHKVKAESDKDKVDVQLLFVNKVIKKYSRELKNRNKKKIKKGVVVKSLKNVS